MAKQGSISQIRTAPVAAATASCSPGNDAISPSDASALLQGYCSVCHNDIDRAGGYSLAHADPAQPGEGAESWDAVVRKLRTGMMPPAAESWRRSGHRYVYRHFAAFCTGMMRGWM